MVYDDEELPRGAPCESERERERVEREKKIKRDRETERERSDGARRVRTRMYASIRVRE